MCHCIFAARAYMNATRARHHGDGNLPPLMAHGTNGHVHIKKQQQSIARLKKLWM
jgi:hypothetical protein